MNKYINNQVVLYLSFSVKRKFEMNSAVSKESYELINKAIRII